MKGFEFVFTCWVLYVLDSFVCSMHCLAWHEASGPRPGPENRFLFLKGLHEEVNGVKYFPRAVVK